MSDTSVEMIETSDVPSSQGDTSNNITVVEETQDISSTDEDIEVNEVSHETDYNIFDGNELINKIIKVCLKLEHSKGMSRVINNCMLPFYDQADTEYKKSQGLIIFLKKTLHKLQSDPDHKFFHLKNLCNNLKAHKFKKRANFITLTTNLEGINGNNSASSSSTKRLHNSVNKMRKKQKVDVIDLEDEMDVIIDLDSDNDCSLLNQNKNCDKENNLPIKHNGQLANHGEHSSNRELNNNLNFTSEENKHSENYSNEVEQSFLVPIRSSSVEASSLDEAKIKEIEEEIAYCKRQICLLDEEEVCYDSMSSPYIRCEEYKAKIVELYKELCKLTGDEPVKRREVHLKVVPGRPPEPVKYLEEFLNHNIGDNGEPPFPDFHDVVSCVKAANNGANLGWSAVRVMSEANALFTQCGRALQKFRQQREWRDMLSSVNLKVIKDPADEDPELMARLEENKRLARKKEEDVIEMFSSVDHKAKNNNSQQMELIVTNEQDSCEESDDGKQSNGDMDSSAFRLKNGDIKSANVSSIAESENTEVNNTKVKTEKLDISSMLDELGDDFSATIIEVEDPFMVIEISSDSEDEDGST